MSFLLFYFFTFLPLSSFAQESLPKRLDKKLSDKYYSSKYDSAYVVRPEEKWLLRLLLNSSGNHIHA